MKCENYFCVYWEKNNCVLEEVSLDIQGSCVECIYLSISEDVLRKERERIRKIQNLGFE